MAASRKRRQPDKKEQLKEVDTIWIGVRASEANIQRIGALLMLLDYTQPTYEKTAPALLPWEDPNDPRYQKPPELEIDRNRVQNALMPLLEAYLTQHGEEKAKEMIQSFGGARIGELSDTQLLDLHNSLAGEAAHE